ncbi:MAG: FAD:protein FMN transferase [Clostridiales bacterium]|nr:FAD:protein FMN transferase [Clostridiales bacterium]
MKRFNVMGKWFCAFFRRPAFSIPEKGLGGGKIPDAQKVHIRKANLFAPRLSAFIAVFLLVFLLAGCGERPAYITKSDFKLDTVVTVTIYGYHKQAIFDEIFAEIDRLESILSVSVPGSDLDRLAQNSGLGYIGLHPETLFLLRKSIEYSRLSQGAFDVTAGPLISLWNIRDGEGHFPSQEELSAALSLINHEDILFEQDRVMLKNAGMTVNLGAVAKGYIADKIKELLLSKGIKSAVINLGGDIALIGGKPGGEPFKIGVRDPKGAPGSHCIVLEIAEKSVVSSGSYERFFAHQGKEYHHILDLGSGFPVENELISVTVICGMAADGDALSTTAFLLGLEAGLEMINDLPGVSAIFITKDNKIYLSRGFEYGFTITNSAYSLGEVNW